MDRSPVPCGVPTILAPRPANGLGNRRGGWRVPDGAVWALLVGGGLLLIGAAALLGGPVGSAGAPFSGRFRLHLGLAGLLAPAVAAAVLVAVRRRLPARLHWARLLAAGYGAALCWSLALTLGGGAAGPSRPMARARGYLADVPAVGDDPLGFLGGFVGQSGSYSAATRAHPPGPVLVLWALGRLGVHDPALVMAGLTVVGCLSVPLVAVAVRSLCGEQAARRLLPVLVLAPYAVWLAGSMDALTLTLGAAAIACGAVGSERGRSPLWAVGAGSALGLGALCSYSVAWLGVSVLLSNFVRRRPLLNLLGAAAALVPLALARAGGFVWLAGLAAAQTDPSVPATPEHSWLLYLGPDLLLVLIACGPAMVPAARKIRRTPGWPYLAGAGVAVVVSVVAGLSRGEVERAFLPFLPWLLVPAVAPEPGTPADGTAPTPVGLVALGAAAAVVIEAVLLTAS